MSTTRLEPHRTEPQRLRGRLGLTGIVFIVVAGAAPLTVVGGPVPLAFVVGNGAGVPAMFLLTGIVLILFAVGFTAMSTYVRSAGAFYSYAYVGLGRSAGIGTGYLALVSYMSLYVGMYGLLGPAIGSLVESWGGPQAPWWAWSGLALVAVGFIGYRSIEFSGAVLGILLMAEVAVVLVLDIAIFVSEAGSGHLSSGFLDPQTVSSGAPGIAFLFAILGFIGVEATTVFRDEARDPERNVPRATYIAVTFIAAFYIVTSWLMVSGVGDRPVAAVASESPGEMLPNLMLAYVGKVGADIVLVLFVTSIGACILTFHNVVSRYVFSLSSRHLLPGRFSHINATFGSPSRAAVTVSLIAAVGIVLGTVVGLDAVAEFYTWLVGLASLGYVVLLVITTIAVITFFARRPTIAIHPLRARVAPVLALLGLLVALVLILINLKTLVGESAVVAIVVVLVLAMALAVGPIVGKYRPQAGRIVEAGPDSPDSRNPSSGHGSTSTDLDTRSSS